jgi:hypothetical protein
MPRPVAALLALAIAAAPAAVLAGCGEEDAELLPGGTASEINANLDTVKRLSEEEDCAGAESAARQVSEQVEALGGIDPKLKRALEDGAARLNEVVDRCEEEPEETEETEAPSEEEEELSEDEQKEREKEEEKAAKEAEHEEKDKGKGKGPPPSTPGKGEPGPPEPKPAPAPPSETEPPSGGVEPAAPVEEGDEG